MAVGALIGAYQEDDTGALRALFPLAGRTLVEYQVRCAAACGAAPIVVIVERVPQALQDALERAGSDAAEVGFAHARELIGASRERAAGVYLVAPFRRPLRVLELLAD